MPVETRWPDDPGLVCEAGGYLIPHESRMLLKITNLVGAMQSDDPGLVREVGRVSDSARVQDVVEYYEPGRKIPSDRPNRSIPTASNTASCTNTNIENRINLYINNSQS